jgi:hypothetical protein
MATAAGDPRFRGDDVREGGDDEREGGDDEGIKSIKSRMTE